MKKDHFVIPYVRFGCESICWRVHLVCRLRMPTPADSSWRPNVEINNQLNIKLLPVSFPFCALNELTSHFCNSVTCHIRFIIFNEPVYHCSFSNRYISYWITSSLTFVGPNELSIEWHTVIILWFDGPAVGGNPGVVRLPPTSFFIFDTFISGWNRSARSLAAIQFFLKHFHWCELISPNYSAVEAESVAAYSFANRRQVNV